MLEFFWGVGGKANEEQTCHMSNVGFQQKSLWCLGESTIFEIPKAGELGAILGVS